MNGGNGMLDVKDENISMVIEKIHYSVMSKKKRTNNYNENIVLENRIFSILEQNTGGRCDYSI